MAHKLPKDKICILNQGDDQDDLSDNANKSIINDTLEPAKSKDKATPPSGSNELQSANKAETLQSNANTKTKIETLPLHEPKQLTRKENQANEMLNYSLNSSTRAINKIPKGKYGYVEEYDLLKAEKFLSKRRSNVKYDQNVVYGKSTKAHSNASANNTQQTNYSQIVFQPIKEEKEEDKAFDTIKEIEADAFDKEDQDNEHDKEVYNQPDKVKPPIRRKKKVVIVEAQENKISTNPSAKESSQTKTKAKRQKSGTDNQGDTNHLERNDLNADKRQFGINPHNKNFAILFEDNPFLTEPNQKPKPVSGNEHDLYSCSNCEAVYFMCIMNNEPLKVLKCLICNNLINKTSLEFYLNKYKDQLVAGQKKSRRNEKPPKDDQQGKRAKRKEEAADETGITEHWGRLIESNKARIKEQLIYDIVDGKTKMTPKQKEMALNKIKDTPLEEIVKRKERTALSVKAKK